MNPDMRTAWPLVGRQEELALVERAMAHGGRGGIVLAGAAGVGKSRLAGECVEAAEKKGFTTFSAIGTHAAASIPFGALAHLLPEAVPSGPGRANVLRAAAEAMLQQSGDARILIQVDDAHLLDDHSAALLHHLTLTERAFPILVVRTGEPVPDPIVGLWKDEVCDRVELQPLSQPEADELLEAALGSEIEATTSNRLWELTRGNPLFLRELVLAALDDGTIVQTEGVWRWKGPVTPNPRLVEVIGWRLEGLDDNEQEAMEIVAVGEPIEFSILESLASLGAIDGLERRDVIEQTIQRRRIKVRTSHPLYGEVLRAELSPVRAATINRELAEALERTGSRRSGDLLRIAAWRLTAGESGDPALYLQAAQRALLLYDYSLAKRLAQTAAEVGGGPEAAHVLAGSLMGEGSFEEADQIFARLVAEADGDAQLVRAVLARANNLYWDLGYSDEAFDVLSGAESSVSDVDLKDELAAGRAYLLFFTARLDEAIQAGRPILERKGASPRATLEALGAVGESLIYAGRPEEGLKLLDRHLGQIEEILPQVPYGPIAIATYRSLAAFFSGRLSEGVALLERQRNDALQTGPDWAPAFMEGLLGLLLRMQGRVRTASRSLRQGIVLARETNIAGQLALFLVELAHSLALLGDTEGAKEALQEAKSNRLPTRNLFDAWFFFPDIWTCACEGRISTAIEQAIAAADSMEGMGARGLEAIALHDVARLGQPDLVSKRLTCLTEESDGLLIPAFARHTTALVNRDPGALESVSVSFEEMGAFLLAAEAAAEAAHFYRQSESRSRALATASRAGALAGLCEGARTPALADIEGSLPLTEREREVAALAVRGRSNKEIAECLVVSVRTVENHLQNVYTKLGVSGRDELHSFAALN